MADKASRLMTANGPAQLPDSTQAGDIAQEAGSEAKHGPVHASQQDADSHAPENEHAAVATEN